MRDKHNDRSTPRVADRPRNSEGQHNHRIAQSADESDDFITDAEMEVREANGDRKGDGQERS